MKSASEAFDISPSSDIFTNAVKLFSSSPSLLDSCSATLARAFPFPLLELGVGFFFPFSPRSLLVRPFPWLAGFFQHFSASCPTLPQMSHFGASFPNHQQSFVTWLRRPQILHAAFPFLVRDDDDAA